MLLKKLEFVVGVLIKIIMLLYRTILKLKTPIKYKQFLNNHISEK